MGEVKARLRSTLTTLSGNDGCWDIQLLCSVDSLVLSLGELETLKCIVGLSHD